MKPFITELNGIEHKVRIKDKKRYTNSSTALLIIIPIGLALQIATSLYPAYDVTELPPVLAWVN